MTKFHRAVGDAVEDTMGDTKLETKLKTKWEKSWRQSQIHSVPKPHRAVGDKVGGKARSMS